MYGYVEPLRAEVAAAPGYDSFLDYWHILIRHKKTLLRFALAGLVAAILISLVQTPVYRARTSLEIQDFNENFLDLKNVDPTNSTGNYTAAQSYFLTQIKILQSESLLERVIDDLNLPISRPATGWRAFASRAQRLLGLTSSPRLPEKEELIRQAERNLTVRASGETRLVEVLYESQDPKLAADFANTLVSEFIEQSQEMRWKSTQRTGDWLTSHLGEMKAKLEQSEAQLQEYARTSGLTFTSEKDNVTEMRLKELQGELSKAQADRVAKQAKFEEARNKPVESLPEMLDDLTLRDYRLKLTDLQRQLVELGATLTPAHYKVQRVQAQIAELESALKKERTNILRRIGNEYQAARRRERLLAQAYAEQEKIVAHQSSKAIHYGTLKREVDSSRQLYDALLQRVKQAGLAAAMRASNVLVVDAAKPPFLPYKPNVPVNSALGLLCGTFLGFGFVVFRTRLDRSIQAPGDVQVYLNLPELGVIPLAEISETRWISGRTPGKRTPLLAKSLTSDNGAPGRAASDPSDCLELVTWKHKPSPLAESFRATLTSILLPSQNGDHPQVIVVSSPSPAEGKTTVASNLSIAVAEIGRRVLLIDGDLRQPQLHKILGVSNSWGLSDILLSDSPIESVPLSHLVTETRIPGLSLLSSGTSTLSISHLLHSPRMEALLARMRREFQMVLIDAPPMMHLADARLLGRLSDGVVLVFRAGQTTREAALLASQRFVEDGTRILGTVLNSWDPRKTPGHGYGYGYGYSKDHDRKNPHSRHR
ncbi:MAG: polysaccharide biosynthesis tyrosine autokinase [Acidobacteria bacterium]|nr:polysaccharide biosynthesis tyrosine autokinase [Acidobacteriota bacterium]